MKDALLGFETYTAGLAGKGDEIESILRKADTAFDRFDSGIAKINGIVPGLADGKNGELFQKLKSIRELAESFDKRSAVFMKDGRRTLLDISEGANQMDRKFNPQGAARVAPAARRAGPRAPVPRGSR
jgi:phospholipid/cholesterol/gamma-HCH transport system substrate-binding protein